MEHGHDGQSPHIHTASEDSNVTGTGDHFNHSTHHTNHPREHWLALKTAMHWTVDAPATDTTLPATWHTLTRNLAAYIRKQGTSRAERWMSRLTDAEWTLKLRTTNLQENANHRPRDGQGPAYSIFQNRNAPKPAPELAPEQPRPKPRHRPGGAGISAHRAKRSEPDPKAAPVPPPPAPQPKPKSQACPFFTVAERAAMHPEWPDGAEVQRGVRGHAQRTTEAICMVPRQDTGQTGHSWPTWQPAAEDQMAGAPRVGRESGNFEPRTLGRQAVAQCPVQLRTPANQVPPGTVWTGDVPQAWLQEPNVPEDQHVATAISLKLHPGQ